MSKRIQLRRGTTAEANAFTGAVGEVTVDTDKDTLVVHDGVTVGGHPVASRANADGTIELIKKDGTSAGTINALGLFNNTLISTNTNQALTAAQGKVLKDTLDTTVSSSFGVGQTYSDVTASRVSGTTYTNSSTRPIMLSIAVRDGGSSATLYVNSYIAIRLDDLAGGSAGHVQIVTVVPSGQTYKLDATGNLITFWGELR